MQKPVKISLTDCKYDKVKKQLICSVDSVDQRYPSSVSIKSPYTGRVVEFKVIGPEDPRFCMDQWDGEQQMYRPTENIKGVEYLIIVGHSL